MRALDELRRHITEVVALLEPWFYKRGSQYGVTIPLQTPLTSTSWDGDAKTTSDNGIIDLSAVFGAPAGIKGIFARMACYDGTAGEWCALGPSSTEDNALVARIPPGGSATGEDAGFVPCDDNGDVYWSCSGNLDNVWVEFWGYVL